MKKHFQFRGYDTKALDQTIKFVRNLSRDELLQDKDKKANRDPNTVLVCTWHPTLKSLSSILQQNYKILACDPKPCKIYKERSTVAFRRAKTLSNHLFKNDIRQKNKEEVQNCKGCKICKQVNPKKTLVNTKTGAKIDVKPGASCRTKNVIYALNCIKCEKIYVGHTGSTMSERFSKHKYDANNRPDQNEFATHCHQHHDIYKDIEIYILDHGIKSIQERERLEDRYICRLQCMEPNGMNVKIGPYAKEMYKLWTNELKSNAN